MLVVSRPRSNRGARSMLVEDQHDLRKGSNCANPTSRSSKTCATWGRVPRVTRVLEEGQHRQTGTYVGSYLPTLTFNPARGEGWGASSRTVLEPRHRHGRDAAADHQRLNAGNWEFGGIMNYELKKLSKPSHHLIFPQI